MISIWSFKTSSEESYYSDLAPEVTLGGSEWVLDQAYDDIISSVIEGRFESRSYYYSMPEGGSEFKVRLPEEVPSDIMGEINELKDRIISGELIIESISVQPEDVWGL